MYRVRAPEGLAIAHQETARSIREEQALVGIERHRVGAIDPGERGAAAIGEREEAAVGRVDVEPEPLARGDVGEGRQIVDRAGAGGARARHEQERREARGAIAKDGGLDRRGDHAEAIVGGDLHHPLHREAGDERRLAHRVVRLLRGVDHAAQEIGRQPIAPRGDHGAEVGERAAGGEQAARARGQAEHAGEPLDDVLLDLREGGRGQPHAHVAVGGVGDQIGHRRVEEAAAGDVREVAGRGGVEARGDDPPEEQAQDPIERAATLGHRRGERARELLAAGGGVHRLARQRLEVALDAIHRLRDHVAHGLARELERMGRRRGAGLRAQGRGR